MTEQNSGSFANPFSHEAEPEEPPRGSVLAYQRLGRAGRMLDYVSFRAGDGKWYTTGKLAAQGVDWATFWEAVRMHAAGPIMYATEWQPLNMPSRPAIPPGTTDAVLSQNPVSWPDVTSAIHRGPTRPTDDYSVR